MPAYTYRAADARGKRTAGRADASNEGALALDLAARGLVLIDAAEAPAVAQTVARRAGWRRRQGLLEATRALAALLPAGLPLARALATASQLGGRAIAGPLADVRAHVERGERLSIALARHPDTFPASYVGMVRAGERSGDLDSAFARLAGHLEREAELRARLLSAAIYPMLLAIVGAIAVLVLVLFVLPRFAELLTGTGARLPRSTAALLNGAAWLRVHGPLLGVPAVIAATILVWVRRTGTGARAWARALGAVPVVASFRRDLLAGRFARLLHVLLTGGAPLLAALGDAVESLDDPLARDDVARIRMRVRDGGTLARAIAEGRVFPPLLAQLIGVGEESGRLQDFVGKAAELFEQRTERGITRLVALAEPLMIVAFGAVVGFIDLSLLQAIYSVNAGAFR